MPDKKFDVTAAPSLSVTRWSHDDDAHICDFTWWGPHAEWDVIGEVHREGTALRVRTLRLVPHGSDVGDLAEQSAATGQGAAPGVTPALLKQIPLQRLLAQVHAHLLELARKPEARRPVALQMSQGRQTPVSAQWVRHVEAVNQPRPPGRPRTHDAELRVVAETYLEENEFGRGLTRRLAERLGLEPSVARDRIAAARARGYLGAAAQGQRGAAPGPRLLVERSQDADS